jgi:FkbM family methyltransferase
MELGDWITPLNSCISLKKMHWLEKGDEMLITRSVDIVKNDIHFKVTFNPKTYWVWDCIRNNMWEEMTFKIFDRFLKPENAYLDIGAWIGPTVLYGAHTAKHVYAIEPDPIAFKELAGNLSLNPSLESKVNSIHAAIADKPGSIRLYKRQEFGDSTSSLIPTLSDENYCQVKAVTIHDLMGENDLEEINFIKMDIEGGEYFLIPSLHDFLMQRKPTLYLSIHPQFLNDHVNLMVNNKNNENLLNQPMHLAKNLVESLDFYKYIYDRNGSLVNKNAILEVADFGEFVFTNESW